MKRVFTQEHRAKLSAAKKGKPSWAKGKKFTPAHCHALSVAHIGQVAWNKGNGDYAKRLGLGKWMLGKKDSEETRLKKVATLIGRSVSEDTREKLSVAKIGKKNPNWKGGTTVVLYGLRRSLEYKKLRKRILQRDGYKCVNCGAGDRLHIDHIKQFAYFPELRFVDENVRTLCVSCHLGTDTYGKFHRNEMSYA